MGDIQQPTVLSSPYFMQHLESKRERANNSCCGLDWSSNQQLVEFLVSCRPLLVLKWANEAMVACRGVSLRPGHSKCGICRPVIAITDQKCMENNHVCNRSLLAEPLIGFPFTRYSRCKGFVFGAARPIVVSCTQRICTPGSEAERQPEESQKRITLPKLEGRHP